MQGAAGLRKNGVGSASGTVSGFRYNARLLAQEIAKRLGHKQEWHRLGPDDIVPFLLSELRWRARDLDAEGISRAGRLSGWQHGIVPLAHFLDHCEQGSVALTIEMNAEGEIYPVAYVRAGDEIDERALPPHALNDFGGDRVSSRGWRAFL